MLHKLNLKRRASNDSGELCWAIIGNLFMMIIFRQQIPWKREGPTIYIYTNNKYILIWKWWSVLTSDWRGGKDMKKVKVHYEYEEKKEEFCNINVSLVSSSNISWKWRWWLLWMSCCCISSINDWLMFKRGLGNHCRRTHKSRLQMLIYIFVGWAFTHKLDITQ